MEQKWIAMYYNNNEDKLPSRTDIVLAETVEAAENIAANSLDQSSTAKVDIALLNIYTTISK